MSLAGAFTSGLNAGTNQRRLQDSRQQQDRDNKMQTYQQYSAVVKEGADRFRNLIESSPEGVQLSEHERNLMHTAAANADELGKLLGLPPSHANYVNSALTAKNGTKIAQDKGALTAAQTVANAQGENAGGLAAMQGTAAANKANAQVAGTDYAAKGRGEAQQANARIAGTDNVAAGEADSQREMATRKANAMYVLREQGIDPNSDQGQQVQQQFLGMDKQQLDMTTIGIAATQSGASEYFQKGMEAPPEVYEVFLKALKDMKVSSDSFSMFMQQAMAGQQAPRPQAPQPTAPQPQAGVPDREASIRYTVENTQMTRQQAEAAYDQRYGRPQ